jgi:hypothetical protein
MYVLGLGLKDHSIGLKICAELSHLFRKGLTSRTNCVVLALVLKFFSLTATGIFKKTSQINDIDSRKRQNSIVLFCSYSTPKKRYSPLCWPAGKLQAFTQGSHNHTSPELCGSPLQLQKRYS